VLPEVIGTDADREQSVRWLMVMSVIRLLSHDGCFAGRRTV
jgi:hypothetical protein